MDDSLSLATGIIVFPSYIVQSRIVPGFVTVIAARQFYYNDRAGGSIPTEFIGCTARRDSALRRFSETVSTMTLRSLPCAGRMLSGLREADGDSGSSRSQFWCPKRMPALVGHHRAFVPQDALVYNRSVWVEAQWRWHARRETQEGPHRG